MRKLITLRNTRLLQLSGIVMALVGLTGYWLGRDVPRAQLTDPQRDLLGIEQGDFHASFVIAGRDVWYDKNAPSTPILDADGDIIGWNYTGATSVDGINTDTILYVNVVNDDVTMIAIPRDLFIDSGTRRINGVYNLGGPDGLARRVESILGVPIDYYAIINLDIFQNVVDGLGGVEVYVPERMYYQDHAAGLEINLQEGLQVLDGEQASDFIRYRKFQRGDLQRLDNVKSLAYAMLQRVRSLHVRAIGILPALIDTAFEDVETNASPALIRQLLPRLPNIQIRSATLPTIDAVRDGAHGLAIDQRQVDAFLATTFGGTPRAFTEAPDATLLITNRSGIPGLEDWYRTRLEGFGVPRERILTRAAPSEPSPTRLLVTTALWQEADYYASLTHAGKQQIDRGATHENQRVDLELVLGSDAMVRATPINVSTMSQPNAP